MLQIVPVFFVRWSLLVILKLHNFKSDFFPLDTVKFLNRVKKPIPLKTFSNKLYLFGFRQKNF